MYDYIIILTAIIRQFKSQIILFIFCIFDIMIKKQEDIMDDRSLLENIKYNNDGLVPVIAQDYYTNQVLMLAWMNKESLELTIEKRLMTYYSRSRRKLWLKGETSGHFQELKSLSIDCDGDTLLAKIVQTGAACHTGEYSCFYRSIDI